MRSRALASPCPEGSALPPTLTWNPVRSAAPAPDRLASLTGAFVVYAGMLLTGLGLQPWLAAPPRPRPPRTDHWELSGLTTEPTRKLLPSAGVRRSALPALPSAEARPAIEEAVPERTPDSYPQGGQPPAGGGGGVKEGEAPGIAESVGPPFTGGGSPRILDLGETPPAILAKEDPVYPILARRSHLQGSVELSILVDETGRPVRIEVLGGHPAFVAETERVLRAWRFRPATSNGLPCPARFRLTVHFRLQA